MITSFISVTNLIDYIGKEPIELISGYRFQRANPLQINKIKELIRKENPVPSTAFPYEYVGEWIVDEVTGDKKFLRNPLPPEEWRYWVISFDDFNSGMHSDIELAASLLKNELEFGILVLGGTLDETKHPKKFFSSRVKSSNLIHYFETDYFGMKPPKVVTQEDVESIRVIYKKIIHAKKSYKMIPLALDRWENLKKLPRKSDLLIIGLFSIIESLVTHKPKSPKDSITSQVSSKIPKLDSLFVRALSYSDFIGSTDKAQIWRDLYDYRSRIVHGNSIDIKGYEENLQGKSTIIEFLNESVKLLLLLSLNKPDLLDEIKNN